MTQLSAVLPERQTARANAYASWCRRADDAFDAVLAEVRSPDRLHDRSAGQALVRLLTLAGRMAFADALGSLTPWEAAVLGVVLGREDILFASPEHLEEERCNVVAAHSPTGKLSLHPLGETPPDGAVVMGGIAVADELLERARETSAEEDAIEAQERAELDAWLADLEAEGRLQDSLVEVVDRIEHVESVYVYVDGELFSRSDVGNTLVRGGVLKQLQGRPLAEWGAKERLFVAAFSVLFASGRSIRIEEFNGQELSARRLRDWLDRRLRLYSGALDEPVALEPARTPLPELAARVGELRARLERGAAIGIRRVNGLTMAKRERVVPRDELLPTSDPRPELLLRSAEELEVELEDDWSGRRSVTKLTRAALELKRDEPSAEALERLLERIVLSAVLESDSDYGMSSSVREPPRLAGSAESRAEGILGLTKPDFFCAVLPHPGLVDALPQDVMFEVLSSVAARMQFNRWHFIPGNFEREEVPAKRHYFFPPLQPDVGEWCDLRHGGHSAASVRYTIRVPGPSLWREPFVAYGNPFRGFFDIRLVRMFERPFTRRELRIAIRHCLLVDAMWAEIQRVVEESGWDGLVFTGFERDYYLEERWRRVVFDEAVREAFAA